MYHVNIRDSLLFGNLTDDEFESVIDLLEEVILFDGDVLFAEGDPADSIGVVKQGNLQAIKLSGHGDEIVFSEFNAGEIH